MSCSQSGNSRILKEPEVIQSYPCKGKVRFDNNGDILMFTLSRDHEVRGNLVPANSSVEVREKELLIYLSEPTVIQGNLVRERKHTNDHCTLDEHGNLVFFVPENDISIDGIPCKGQEDVWLYPGGRLFMCHLADNHENNGNVFNSGDFVMIDDTGIMQLHTWEKFNEIRIKGLYPEHH